MSTQVHAPPTPAENDAILKSKRTKGFAHPEDIETWCSFSGWCSACKTREILVAHMGTPDYNFALCKACLTRLTDEHRSGEEAEEAMARQGTDSTGEKT